MLRLRILAICLVISFLLPSAFAQPFLHSETKHIGDLQSQSPEVTPNAITNGASPNGSYIQVTGRLATLFSETSSYYLLGHDAPIKLILEQGAEDLYRYTGMNIVVSGWLTDQNETRTLYVENWAPAETRRLNIAQSSPETVGTTLVILVEFSDNTASHTVDYFNNLIFGPTNSLFTYYVEVSYNSLQISGTVTSQWYKLSNPTSYYQVQGHGSTFEEYLKLASDVVTLVDPYLNFALYKHFMMVFAGSWVWGASARGLGISTNDGIVIDAATFHSETFGLEVFAHEFGHDLGLPDLYDYDSLDPYQFIDGWDLMGIQNSPPQGISSWSKIHLGWIPTSQVKTYTGGVLTATIERIESPTTGYLALSIQTSTNIYFLVETRQKIGYDVNLPSNAPSHGVLITMINETREGGHGIVRLVDANPNTRSYRDGDAVWQVGQTYTNTLYSFSVSIESWTGTGFVLEVSQITSHVSDISDVLTAPSETVNFVYPDYQGTKPPEVGYAWLSDWAATGFIIGMCSNPQIESTDTNPTLIDTSSGAVKLLGSTIVLFGGPRVNAPVNYYEVTRKAPVYYQKDQDTLYWYRADGTRLDSTGIPAPVVSTDQDMFVVESFVDGSGNKVYIVYGYGWKGTFAGGKFFKFVLYPNLASYTGSYYIFKWVDGNGDGFVDLNEISTTPVAWG